MQRRLILPLRLQEPAAPVDVRSCWRVSMAVWGMGLGHGPGSPEQAGVALLAWPWRDQHLWGNRTSKGSQNLRGRRFSRDSLSKRRLVPREITGPWI